MGLHLAIREQVATNRPHGIKSLYKNMLDIVPDQLTVEHKMMEILEEELWQSQRNQTELNDSAYLRKLKTLANHIDT